MLFEVVFLHARMLVVSTKMDAWRGIFHNRKQLPISSIPFVQLLGSLGFSRDFLKVSYF